MKTAIYIEDGTVQLVITPESEFEKAAMKSFGGPGELEAQLFQGAFYDCRGGWVRQKPQYNAMRLDSDADNDADNSLILRMSKPRTPECSLPGPPRHKV